MRIFISHQQRDSDAATRLVSILAKHRDVTTYVDVLDSHLNGDGDGLAEYLRNEIGKGTHLMAVISENTRYSWWVPFEIGIATEKRLPLSTLALGITPTSLPSYLAKWPVLAVSVASEACRPWPDSSPQ